MKEYVITLITLSFISSFLSLLIDKKYQQIFNFCTGIVFVIFLISPMFSIDIFPQIDTDVPQLKTQQLKDVMYEQMAKDIESKLNSGKVKIVVEEDKIQKIIITGTTESAQKIANAIGVNPNLVEVR